MSTLRSLIPTQGHSVCGGKGLGLSSDCPHPWGVEGRTGSLTPYSLSPSPISKQNSPRTRGPDRCPQQGQVKVISCALWVR